jgi:hypothetical protein
MRMSHDVGVHMNNTAQIRNISPAFSLGDDNNNNHHRRTFLNNKPSTTKNQRGGEHGGGNLSTSAVRLRQSLESRA